ncbi:hypothetical protein [Chitinophaga filiformis]|uniref:Uncharacterized protein n=1 Tax=Chitinophaga filiformis TaxID=104663 RepID=A0A1G8D7M7_CHIFI|nr:hypothetical protein [Chitinophaga filiformis]SDH53359.1 hypothetical protein SAMN04488121_1147 [Chitinophaga filiformis]
MEFRIGADTMQRILALLIKLEMTMAAVLDAMEMMGAKASAEPHVETRKGG